MSNRVHSALVTGNRRRLGAAAFVSSVLAVNAASATCPPGPVLDPEVCEPHVAMLVPGLTGMAYLPRNDDLGLFYGGGLEVALLTWSNSSESFGPAMGRLRFSVNMLTSSEADARPAYLYRGGTLLSFEKNPARTFLVPYFSGDLGGLHVHDLGGRLFVDGGIGAYLVYLPRFMLDLEASYLFTFEDPDDFGGPTAHLTASFSFW